MYKILDDIDLIKAILNDFVPFIRSNTVFWQLSNPGPFSKRYPILTIAGMLFCIQKLTTVKNNLNSKTLATKNTLVNQMNHNLHFHLFW